MNLPFIKPLPEVEIAINAALKAGKEILKMYTLDFKINYKGINDPVTEADMKSNDIITAMLNITGFPILSEEGSDKKSYLGHDCFWIVDPLDGTKNFIGKDGQFSVMIGLVKDCLVVLGIVYQPTTGDLFMAQKGSGAYEKTADGWKKLMVNNENLIEDCTAVMSKNHISDRDLNILKDLHVSKITHKGSGGLKVGEICRGNADIYFNSSNKQKLWDTCASYCIISEAGGKMTDMLGNPFDYCSEKLVHENGVLVTNFKFHDLIVKKHSMLK